MLSRFPDLSVIARNSSFVYKGKPVDIRQVGRDLNVDYALEGSVRKEADQVRITAQLIDTQTGKHVWADRYDKAGKDPLALQDEVTGKIVGAMTGETGQVKQGPVSRRLGQGHRRPWRIRLLSSRSRCFYERDLEGGERPRRRIWEEGLAKYPDFEPAQGKAWIVSLQMPAGTFGATTFRRTSERQGNWSGRCSPRKT